MVDVRIDWFYLHNILYNLIQSLCMEHQITENGVVSLFLQF